ncbi:Redox-sensing transcriptional repressor Rex [Marinomonas spartinae]|uniref:Redox-sensing transcriptional repressor Rex n=1 Tax=Marinomonas spartinae TaxID=1792290 RepID=A0A1A8TF36_9GAMM|nr:hypothetical protein [Marinomonas spartinae]SBS31628.1 Redox-sensing transcriptional repressor Rex [Marinomonas spartinae]
MGRMQRWFTHLLGTKRPITHIILVGIDYPSYALAQALQNTHTHLKIVALIDEEPWVNKTQMHGITIYYPSDLCALIKKHSVKWVIQIDGQKPKLSPEVIHGIQTSKATLLHFPSDMPLEEQIDQLKTISN